MFLPAIQPFKLELHWLQAQAFRWTEPNEDGWYYGVVHDSLIRVRNARDGIEFESDASDEALAPHVVRYFRLDQDITQVHEALRQGDSTDTMDCLIKKYGCLRILRQDPWECLVAYICSQNNSVDRVTQIVEGLAHRYGPLHTLDGTLYPTFPTPQQLAQVEEGELRSLRLGLDRGPRIHRVAVDVTEDHLDFRLLGKLRYPQAKALLMSYEGIGQKIADCVCLFSLDRSEAFPMDVHIGRGLEKHYEKTYKASGTNARLLTWARDRFGEHAGYASQLLFLDGYLRG